MLATRTVSDEDVLFFWSLSSVDIVDEEESKELLNHIVKLWLTIRGFSLANEWVEKYKWKHHASTVKAKSLRKGLKSAQQKKRDDISQARPKKRQCTKNKKLF